MEPRTHYKKRSAWLVRYVRFLKFYFMKKLILLLTFVIASFTSTFSQDKGHIGLSVGLSTPMGDFATNKSSDENAGFATTGFLFDLDGTLIDNMEYHFKAWQTLLKSLGKDWSLAGIIHQEQRGNKIPSLPR